MLQPPSPRRGATTLTGCLESGRPRPTTELEACKCEGCNYGSEAYRLKSSLEDTDERLDVVRRENKNLAEGIKDLLDQLGDGGRSIHELDKQRRRLEVEKKEPQGAFEEENEVLRAALELAQVRQEIDRRIAEKEDEVENSRKNHARAMDSMQASLEAEELAEAEAELACSWLTELAGG